MLARLAEFSFRRKWTVLGLWIVALVGITRGVERMVR